MTLFFQAIGYYGLAENEHDLLPYLSGEEIGFEEIASATHGMSDSTPIPHRLEVLLDEISSKGIDPIVLDYSHPDWAHLSIIKAFVPELTTPFLQSRPMLGHPRLSDLRESVLDSDGRALPLPYP